MTNRKVRWGEYSIADTAFLFQQAKGMHLSAIGLDMFGKIVFSFAILLFLTSLFTATVLIGEEKSLTGIETFFYTIRHATAGLFGAGPNRIVSFVALLAAAANFVFIFWAMLVFSSTRITSLRWFWWTSMLFLIAASYTGFQAILRQGVSLASGYYIWLCALVLMLLAPVIARAERKRRLLKTRHT